MADRATIKVLLICASGMSSSMLEASMVEAAEAAGVILEVRAYFSNIVTYWDFEKHPFNVILIAPQVRFIRRSVAKKAEPLGIIVRVIDPVTYGMVDGAKLFHQIMGALQDDSPEGLSAPT